MMSLPQSLLCTQIVYTGLHIVLGVSTTLHFPPRSTEPLKKLWRSLCEHVNAQTRFCPSSLDYDDLMTENLHTSDWIVKFVIDVTLINQLKGKHGVSIRTCKLKLTHSQGSAEFYT